MPRGGLTFISTFCLTVQIQLPIKPAVLIDKNWACVIQTIAFIKLYKF